MNPIRRSSFIQTLLTFIFILNSCGSPQIPTENVDVVDAMPILSPDYTDIIMPPNIAPMNFEINMPGEQFMVRVKESEGKTLIAEGKSVRWDIDEWHELLNASKGKELAYEVYVSNGGRWELYKFSNKVAEENIDPYFSYRLIEPSYTQYAGLTINQRDLTSFDEEVIFNNPSPCDERRGYCINCHVPRNQYKDRSSLFHVRGVNGGTMIMTGGKVEKINLKNDSTISAGVYPAWHPTDGLIAFSTNGTSQKFLATGAQKVEVYDNASDIILYDVKARRISNVSNSPDLLETYPAWHPNGRKIYYSVAQYPEGITPDNVPENAERMRYDIVSRDFDIATRKFSEPDTVVHATADSMSVLLPRISPDGRYLLYCKAPFGSFHIWHKESDLYITDLTTGEERALLHANSADSDSYHSWSSNSRWVVFSSRRDDGSYTRPYITYVSADGMDSKAFVVPQEAPDYYQRLMKSYNVPEFMVEPFAFRRNDIIGLVRGDAEPVTFRQ